LSKFPAGFTSDLLSKTDDSLYFNGKKGDVSITAAYIMSDKGFSLSVLKKK